MRALSAKMLAEMLGGELIAGRPESTACSVSIDSRHISPGELFVALRGDRHDGHDYVAQSMLAGAAGAVGERFSREQLEVISACSGFAIRVCNTLSALHRLASRYRESLDLTCVAVTGSTGKTTTKDMLGFTLSGFVDTVATEGNQNNEIGLPLTVLRSTETTRALVVEMGMRGLGQIELLCKVAQPDIGVVTGVNDTHIELLGSRDRIAQAKAELIAAVPRSGGAVLNGDDPLVRSMAGQCKGRVITVGTGSSCDLVAHDITSLGIEGIQFRISGVERIEEVWTRLPGVHNVYNALFTMGVCYLIGYNLELAAHRLATFSSASSMRMSIKTTRDGVTIIDDSYNASPTSMRAALKVLMDVGANGRTIAILGDMLELGHLSEAAHREIGEFIAEVGPDITLTVGELARFICHQIAASNPDRVAESFETKAQVIERLEALLRPGDTVLVKGSRGMRMDEVVESLIAP